VGQFAQDALVAHEILEEMLVLLALALQTLRTLLRAFQHNRPRDLVVLELDFPKPSLDPAHEALSASIEGYCSLLVLNQAHLAAACRKIRGTAAPHVETHGPFES
jgi:hypothetical protein